MRALENLRLSLRYVRMRLLESLLAVVGTLLGVAVIAAAVTLIQTYDAGIARELSGPTYRLIDVSPRGQQRLSNVPIQRVGASQGPSAELQISDMPKIKAECPSVDFVFSAVHEISNVGDIAGMTYSSSNASVSMAGGKAQSGIASGLMVQSGAVDDGPVVTSADAMTSVVVGGDAGGPSGTMQIMTAPLTPGGKGAQPAEAIPGTAVSEPAAPPPGKETIKPLVKEFDLVRTTMDGFGGWGATLARGSLFTEQDTRSGSPVLVLGDELARRMFGAQDPLGNKFRSGGVLWTVIGILAPAPYSGPEKNDFNRWAFAPFQMPAITLGGHVLAQFPLSVRNVTLAVKDTKKLRAATAEATAYFTRAYGEDSFVIRAYMLEAEQARDNHNRLFVVIGFLAGAALLISSITLLNLMTTRTLRRARSIGIFRSLGASARDIFAIFLGESLVLTLIGGLAGFALAPFLYHLLLTQLIPASWGVDLGTRINWLVMAGSLAGAVVLNVLFGIPPAAQAARTGIVDAIRAD
jgi:hypothetical protein